MALQELRGRRTATLVTALGLVTACLGFLFLATTSRTAEAVLTGDIRRAFNTPYDILVRPANAASSQETVGGLVRPNYLQATNAGITLAQLQTIRGISGVRVAAPIAFVGGFYYPLEGPSVDLTSSFADASLLAFRVSTSIEADAGYSRLPAGDRTFLYAPHGSLVVHTDGGSTLTVGSRTVECPAGGINCYAPSVRCEDPALAAVCEGMFGAYARIVTTGLAVPVIVAGIDPAAEAELTGLGDCIVGGRNLVGSDTVSSISGLGVSTPVLPAIFSNRTFVDATLDVRVDRLPSPPVQSGVAHPNTWPGWTTLVKQSVTSQAQYRAALQARATSGFGTTGPKLFQLTDLLTPGDVSYIAAAGTLAAQNHPPVTLGPDGLLADSWFRPVQTRAFAPPSGPPPGAGDGIIRVDQFIPFATVGEYNPDCLAGFDPLAGGRLDAYAPPDVRLGDGRALEPNPSIAGYVGSPPTLLTTLEGASVLDDPVRFHGGPGAAFISAIRVRVNGASQPGSAAEAQLARIAAAIAGDTGLTVDIIRGSSPVSVSVQLAPGRFGRPVLTVTEPWAKKGVDVRFTDAVSVQNLVLFVLVVIAAALLVAQTAYMSVRRRRRELGVLWSVGWPRSRLAVLIELETLIVGTLSGVIAAGVAFVVGSATHLEHASARSLLVVPLSMLVAAVAAFVPAMTVLRGQASAVVQGPGSVRRQRVPRGALTLGIRELLTAWRVESALGVVSVALGTALLGLVVTVSLGFAGQLDSTRLGVDLAQRVRPFHFVLAALTLAVGTLSVAEVIALGFLERRTHISSLRAVGWPRAHIARQIVGQSAAIAGGGGLLGLVSTTAIGLWLGAGFPTLLIAGAAVLAMVVVVAACASAAPLWLSYRVSPAAGLRD